MNTQHPQLDAAARQSFFDTTLQLTLDNFSLAVLVTKYLKEHAARGIPMPKATLNLESTLEPVTIQGQNCGYFTTPVMQMALLDTRKTVEFFGLAVDLTSSSLKPIKSRRPDDLGIENFGLSQISRQSLLQVQALSSLEPQLIETIKWSNKQLAHFTQSAPTVGYDSMANVFEGMIEAYLTLLFDALRVARPRIKGR